jgi:hypothetical protein
VRGRFGSRRRLAEPAAINTRRFSFSVESNKSLRVDPSLHSECVNFSILPIERGQKRSAWRTPEFSAGFAHAKRILVYLMVNWVA